MPNQLILALIGIGRWELVALLSIALVVLCVLAASKLARRLEKGIRDFASHRDDDGDDDDHLKPA